MGNTIAQQKLSTKNVKKIGARRDEDLDGAMNLSHYSKGLIFAVFFTLFKDRFAGPT
jgi:hypothetical protein